MQWWCRASSYCLVRAGFSPLLPAPVEWLHTGYLTSAVVGVLSPGKSAEASSTTPPKAFPARCYAITSISLYQREVDDFLRFRTNSRKRKRVDSQQSVKNQQEQPAALLWEELSPGRMPSCWLPELLDASLCSFPKQCLGSLWPQCLG